MVVGVGEGPADKEAATKAAAWLWYMRGGSGGGTWHEPWWAPAGSARTGALRRESRFKAEAAAAAATKAGSSANASSKWTSYYNSVWESSCESQVYDSMELLSLSDRLTRTLSASPSITSSTLLLPTHVPVDIGRDAPSSQEYSSTPNAPHRLHFACPAASLHGSPAPTSPPQHTHDHHAAPDLHSQGGGIEHENVLLPKRPNLWSVQGFVHALKKVATNAIRKRSRSPSRTHHYQNACSHHHHYHHHHHHYHHFLHHPCSTTIEDQDGSTPL